MNIFSSCRIIILSLLVTLSLASCTKNYADPCSNCFQDKPTQGILQVNVNPNIKTFRIIDDMARKNPLYARLDTVVARRADFSRAMKEGLGITEYAVDKNNKARQSILSLKDEVQRYIKTLEGAA